MRGDNEEGEGPDGIPTGRRGACLARKEVRRGAPKAALWRVACRGSHVECTQRKVFSDDTIQWKWS